MASVKRVVYFLLPASLLAFIFFQNFAPIIHKTSELVTTAEAAQAVAPVAPEKAELPLDPKSMRTGIYYAYKADYNCTNPKDPKAPPVPSHIDSYGVENGKICHLGDVCNESFTCGTRLPVGMTLSKDKRSLFLNGRSFRLQQTAYPPGCAMPSCAPPPDNCIYSVAAPLNERGCSLGCGSMLCRPQVETCPVLECSVPPANCAYDGQASLDSNNCPISCGKIACDTVGDEISCPKLECATPPENCRYDRNFKKDAKGCKVSCGSLTCDRPTAEAPECKPVECAMPPAGCNYEGAIPRDENGCMTSCGSLVCTRSTPSKCKIPQCDPPPVNCRYDGNSPLDFDGCSSSCGDLICNPDEAVSL